MDLSSTPRPRNGCLTFVNGTLVAKDGEIVAEPGTGTIVSPIETRAFALSAE